MTDTVSACTHRATLSVTFGNEQCPVICVAVPSSAQGALLVRRLSRSPNTVSDCITRLGVISKYRGVISVLISARQLALSALSVNVISVAISNLYPAFLEK